MTNIPMRWRLQVAQMMKFPVLNRLMFWGIQLTVPRRRVGVALVALDDENRVLMLKHVFHSHTPWGLPGGWLNRQESPAVGVLRELKEETGLTAVLDSIVLIENQDFPPHLGIIYRGRIQSGQIKLSSEIIEAGWFPTDELPTPIQSFVKSAIETAVHPLDHIKMEGSNQTQ